MNLASLHSEYIEDADKELNNLALSEENIDIEEILKHFYALNNTLKDKMYTEKANDVLKAIPMKMEVFYEKFDEECMKIPILKYYDPYQLFQRILCASNEDIMIIKEKLVERAKKHTQELKPELKNITKLKEIVEQYLKGKETTIKTVMLVELQKDLENIINLMNNDIK